MVEINIAYEGDLHCHATHGPSGQSLQTDAPVDNNGRGESFSPTDLVATALGACMATVIGIIARRKDINLTGMTVQVRKFMSTDTPRRISRLEVDIAMPIPPTHPDVPLFESSARACPVHQSLHPDIEIIMNWTWTDHTQN
jgi:putative redox protein